MTEVGGVWTPSRCLSHSGCPSSTPLPPGLIAWVERLCGPRVSCMVFFLFLFLSFPLSFFLASFHFPGWLLTVQIQVLTKASGNSEGRDFHLCLFINSKLLACIAAFNKYFLNWNEIFSLLLADFMHGLTPSRQTLYHQTLFLAYQMS